MNVWTCLIGRYIWAKPLQSYPTLSDPTDCSTPGSSAHGFLQARMLEWLSCSPPGISPTWDPAHVSYVSRTGLPLHYIFTSSTTWEALIGRYLLLNTTWLSCNTKCSEKIIHFQKFHSVESNHLDHSSVPWSTKTKHWCCHLSKLNSVAGRVRHSLDQVWKRNLYLKIPLLLISFFTL